MATSAVPHGDAAEARLASVDTALRAEAARWLAEARPALCVRVAEARGSVPRPAGTAMLVAADAVAGSIGGGQLEWQAIDTARRWLAHGGTGLPGTAPLAPPPTQRLALGPALGQCCGGAVHLVYEVLDATALARWPAPRPRFTLQLHGAGHVGGAVARVLADIDCAVQWVDERDDLGPSHLSVPGAPHIRGVATDSAVAEVANAPPGSWALVMTHRHDLDFALVEALLRRGDMGWIGLIGSATKRARFVHRLRDRGLPAERLEGLVCPVGLPGLTGKAPAEIAVSVVAQLLQLASASRPSAATSSTLTR